MHYKKVKIILFFDVIDANELLQLLNDKGIKKYYLNNESHATTYLSHINPIIFEHILGKKYEDLMKKEETKEPIKEEAKENIKKEILL